MNYQKIITEIYNIVDAEEDRGQVSSYIPELAKVDSKHFGVFLTTTNHVEIGTGRCYTKFSIIIAIHPGKYSIAVWSPNLNEKGNSCKGMKFLELLTTKTKSSIF